MKGAGKVAGGVPADDMAVAPPGGGAILITGASGALGGALAQALAAPGARLMLWGRDAGRLAAVADACTAAGARCETVLLDLADAGAAVARLAAADRAAPIAEAWLVAGLGDPAPPGARVEPPDQVARLLTVNLATPAALAAALAQRMEGRGHGRIVLIGSAAGFHALPFAAGYAGSKAGLARFADALRIAVAPAGVVVSLVSPGFIARPGRDDVPRAVQTPLPTVAARVLAAGRAGRAHAIVPAAFAWLRLVDRALPRPIRDRLLRALRR
jgi:short-subunit dehydrogenase